MTPILNADKSFPPVGLGLFTVLPTAPYVKLPPLFFVVVERLVYVELPYDEPPYDEPPFQVERVMPELLREESPYDFPYDEPYADPP